MKSKQDIINGFICNLLYSKSVIQRNIQRLADEIFHDYKNKKNIVLLIVMNGGMDFGMDLSRALQERGLKHARENITASRYTKNGKGTRTVDIHHKSDLILTGKNVIVVEDLVDKGITLNVLHLYLKELETRSLCYAVLGTKENHAFTQEIKYKVFKNYFPDLWLFGYGMDWEDEYRSLECIMYNTQKIA